MRFGTKVCARHGRPLVLGLAILLTISLAINSIRYLSAAAGRTRRVPVSADKLREFTMVVNNLSHAVIAAEKESVRLQDELVNIVTGLVESPRVADLRTFDGTDWLKNTYKTHYISPETERVAQALLVKLKKKKMDRRQRSLDNLKEVSRRSDTLPNKKSTH